MTPIKDYLIALSFAYMYYTQGLKNVNKPLDDKEKEKMLFDSINEGKELPVSNLQYEGMMESNIETEKNNKSSME